MSKLIGVLLVIGAAAITASGAFSTASAASGGGDPKFRWVSYHQYGWHEPDGGYGWYKPELDVTIQGRKAKIDRVVATLIKPGHPDVRSRGNEDPYGGNLRHWRFGKEFVKAVRDDFSGGKCSGLPDAPKNCVAKVKARALRGDERVAKARCTMELGFVDNDPTYNAGCGFGHRGRRHEEGDRT